MTYRVTLAEDLSVGIGDDGLVTIALRKDATTLAKRLPPAEADELVAAVMGALAVIRARGKRPPLE